MSHNKLDEISERASRATEGPWETRDCAPCTERGRLEVNIYDHTGNFQITTWYDDDEFHRPDAEFIAHAREDVPKLVAALRAVEAVHYDSVGDCAACVDECGCCPLDYPCPTITAIRVALN